MAAQARSASSIPQRDQLLATLKQLQAREEARQATQDARDAAATIPSLLAPAAKSARPPTARQVQVQVHLDAVARLAECGDVEGIFDAAAAFRDRNRGWDRADHVLAASVMHSIRRLLKVGP